MREVRLYARAYIFAREVRLYAGVGRSGAIRVVCVREVPLDAHAYICAREARVYARAYI